jgi:hypothetical protein
VYVALYVGEVDDEVGLAPGQLAGDAERRVEGARGGLGVADEHGHARAHEAAPAAAKGTDGPA